MTLKTIEGATAAQSIAGLFGRYVWRCGALCTMDGLTNWIGEDISDNYCNFSAVEPRQGADRHAKKAFDTESCLERQRHSTAAVS